MAIIPTPAPTRYIFGFNGIVVPDGYAADGSYNRYADHRPQYHQVYAPPAPTDVNLNRRSIGMRGYPRARLWWDRISDETFQWWAQWVSENVPDTPITAIVLHSAERRVGTDAPPYHRIYYTGLLTRIRLLDDAFPRPYDGGRYWQEGGAEVWINELDGVVDGVPIP